MTKEMVSIMVEKMMELEKLNPLKLAEYKGRLDAVHDYEVSKPIVNEST